MKEFKTPRKVSMKRLFRRNQIIITTLAIMIAAAGYLNYASKKEVAAGSGAYQAGAMEISDEDVLAENQALSGKGGYKEIASLDDPSEGNGTDQMAAAKTETKIGQPSAGGTNASDGANHGGKDAAQNATQAAAGKETAASPQETKAPDGNKPVADSGAAKAGLDNPGEAVLTSGMNVSDYIANVQLSREQVRAKNKETLMNIINNANIDETAKQKAIQEMIDMTAVSEKENAAETLLMAKGFADPVVSITNGKVDVVINAASITDPQRAQIEDIVKRKAEVGADNIIITLLKLQE